MSGRAASGVYLCSLFKLPIYSARCSESVDKMFAYERTWVESTIQCDTNINERLVYGYYMQ